MPDIQTEQKQTQNLKSTGEECSNRKSSISDQFSILLLLVLKLKAWRAVFLIIPVAFALSNIFLTDLLRVAFESPEPSTTEIDKNHGLDVYEFYGTSDFISSGQTVLVDRSTFSTEVNALDRIMTDRGGNTDWLKDCTSERKCKTKFISENDASIIGYISYSKTSSKRAILECRWIKRSSNHRCAFLYQLMAQSMLKDSITDGVFKDVQFFSMLEYDQEEDKVESVSTPLKNISLPESLCSKVASKGGVSGLQNYLTFMTRITLGLTAFGLSFYSLIGTCSCIRSLKTDGFFQQLVSNGLSPACYWSIIWPMTILECALISGIFVLSRFLQCPGVFPEKNAANLLIYMFFYCLFFAAISILLELLIPSMAATFLLTVTMIVSVCLASAYYKKISATTRFLFPITSAEEYMTAHLFSNIERIHSGTDSIEQNHPLHQNMLTSVMKFVLLTVVLITYLDFLLKSGNGLCLPPYYIFSYRFWKPKYLNAEDDKTVDDDSKTKTESHIEPVIGFSPTIIVENVVKAYNSRLSCSARRPPVLKGLSCKIYKNQITALIGHNGAGKSTLIKLLTGEEFPDSGVAFINGVKVTDPIERLALRGSISICPQFDALCGELTVIESIRVTLNCNGMCSNMEMDKARTMLQRLGLGDKENVMSTDLSGGQKRKVNTILALLGDPHVVFLDEPTSGLDPVSRRQLWQMLQEEKLGRSIVLCTQFMDEADVLADRKIFLCDGQIVCAGSSMFLKQAFGCSFAINVSLKSKSNAPNLMSRLKNVQMKSQFETELQLEVSASKPSALVDAVEVLESSQEIEAFGLSQTTLDDIFMKLSGRSSSEIIDAFKQGNLNKFLNNELQNPITKENIKLDQSLDKSEKVQRSFLQQFVALLCINVKRQLRSRGSILSRFVVPAVLLAAIYYTTNTAMKAVSRSAGISNPSKPSAGIDTTRFSRIRTLFDSYHSFSFKNISIVCVYDDMQTESWNSTCQSMSSSNKSDTFLLGKSQSESLKSFMVQNNTLQFLKEKCTLVKGCIIYYASSWNESLPNKMRDISIGLFASDASKLIVTVHAFQQAFSAMSQHFGAGDLIDNTALSHIKPYSLHESRPSQILELVVFLVIFGLFPVSYLSDPIEDICSRVRAHLVSMGMTHIAYWINTFLLHWIQYIVCFIISICLICTWDRYGNTYFILVCIPTLVLGTASNQFTVYTIAVVTKTRSTIVVFFVSLIAILLPIIFITLSSRGATVVESLICLLPPVAPIALIQFSMLYATYCLDYYTVDHVSDIPDLYENCWSNFYIMLSLLMMPIHIAIMCGIIAFVENISKIAFCRRHSTGDSDKSISEMDQGAHKESERVLQRVKNPQNVLEVRHLYKTYPNGVRAVRGVTFGSMAGEIFGLLGANGAGKSTSMSVIVGEELASSGECEVRMKDGTWLSGRAGASSGAIGYCPQHNPLFDCITVAEHMRLYADIRGLPNTAIQRQVIGLIKGLGLQPHIDKCANQLSGGNKRRLCLAIALLGDPSLIVVDEASTGVDPENKRFIWSAIRGMVHAQRSVMVTTHSMEEVEALCSRVGIMNKGQMIAFGTVQQLRSLHGDAYTLEILLKQENTVKTTERKATVKTVVASQFKGAVVLHELSLCLQFYIPKRSVTRVSSALQWLTANQSRLGVEYSSFYQMSLDQVFVKLVMQYDKSTGTK